MLLGIHLGIRVFARARPERALLEGMVRPALALLNSSPDGAPRPASALSGSRTKSTRRSRVE
jgi:hypothetical protein